MFCLLHPSMHSFRRSSLAHVSCPVIRAFLHMLFLHLSIVLRTYFIFFSIICHFTCSVWLSSLIMQIGVPLVATLNIFLKKLSCTDCILSICLFVSMIQLSQFVNILKLLSFCIVPLLHKPRCGPLMLGD